MGVVIYWAGPLFSQAERIWNRLCADELRRRGHTVILPQDEATAFIVEGEVDFCAIAEHCFMQATTSDVVIAALDGADADSGTSVEVGLRIGSRRKQGGAGGIIGVRTDIRASEDRGLNAMFRLLDDVIYFPSLNEDVTALVDAIDDAIQKLTVVNATH